MKVKKVYKLPDDRVDLEIDNKASSMLYVLCSLRDTLRSIRKNGKACTVDQFEETFHEILSDNYIDLSTLGN